MNHLDLIKLPAVMERTSGKPEIMVGLLDGPVVTNHPDIESEHIREIPGSRRGACTQTESIACLHGTFVAGILCAKRSSDAPAICPNCTLLVRPIFIETQVGSLHMPSATPEELAAAILDCIRAGARLLNLRVAVSRMINVQSAPFQTIYSS
jgi:Subtilase family